MSANRLWFPYAREAAARKMVPKDLTLTGLSPREFGLQAFRSLGETKSLTSQLLGFPHVANGRQAPPSPRRAHSPRGPGAALPADDNSRRRPTAAGGAAGRDVGVPRRDLGLCG